ncbi:MAG: 2,3-bisphosphoglycerate-independent phosphoglycerate mutase [Pseudohongiellaceae bacterium]|jgi:2,3-bisphosphoglycerate-independent phosphoglycerate mutase
MKALILLATGISDDTRAGPTPLELIDTPHLDRVANDGRLGQVRFAPTDERDTAAVALASVLGYDTRRDRVARGVAEAAGMGVELGPDDLALRLNFVTTWQGRLADFRAGRIGRVEARLLIEALSAEFVDEDIEFFPGQGYRNLMVMRGGRKLSFETIPPQEVLGQLLSDSAPYGRDADKLVEIINRCSAVLADHDVNRVRLDLGENPANVVWLWGPGSPEVIEPFELRTGRKLTVVAGVPMARGIGLLAGAEAPVIPGASGDLDTDFEAKRLAALAALDHSDVVLLHIAAGNEACHAGALATKAALLADLDEFLVGPLLEALATRNDTRLLVTTDHMTSAARRSGPAAKVPFAMWGPGITPLRRAPFCETAAAQSDLDIEHGHTLLEFLLDSAPSRAPGGDGTAAKSEQNSESL